jgi:membrane protein
MVGRSRRWTGAERARFEKELQSRRGTSRVVGAGFDIAELDVHVGGGILAGAVAFRLFLFLVPFVYVLFTLLGWAAKAVNQNPEHLANVLGITGILASAIVGTQSISVLSQILLLVGASFATLITANSLVKTLFVVHWLVWGVPRAKPSGLRPVGATIGLALIMTALSVATNAIRSHFGLAGSLLVVLLVTGLAFILWWWISWRLPHAAMSPQHLIPGAVFVAIGADVMHALTTYWIGAVVARKSHTYGAIGIALAVLLWVYVFGRILVASAGVNATLWRRQQPLEAEPPGPGSVTPRNPA